MYPNPWYINMGECSKPLSRGEDEQREESVKALITIVEPKVCSSQLNKPLYHN